MKHNLLLLHGALGCHLQFDSLREKLSDKFEVHTFDFSGHGGRATVPEFTISLFVRDTLREMELLQLMSTHLFGYSMGGYVALQLGRDHPQRAEKIITLGTKLHWDPESAAGEVRMMDPVLMEQKLPAFTTALEARHHPGDWKEVMRKTGDMMLELGNGLAVIKDEDFRSISHECLLCIGSKDQMVSVAETRRVASLLPYGRCRVFDGWKHPLEMVDEDLLCREITDFLL